MPSFRSKLFAFILRNKHLLKFQLKRRDSIEANTSIADLREEVEKGANFFGKLPEGFTLEPFKIGELSAEWMLPQNATKKRAILYFHGGGLVVGSIHAHRGIVAKFVKASGTEALLFDYSLAPENPFPAGLNDSLKAYKYLLDEGIKPENIVFMGDSGGGNLVFSTMLLAKEKGLPLPSGAIALSPWTDLTNSGESWVTNAKADSLCWKDAQAVFSKYYAVDNELTNPLISPLFGDLKGFPPLLLYAGNDETMRDDSTRLAKKAKEAGVDVTLNIGEGLFHCYPACAPMFPEATQALNEIADFIKKQTS
jgi:acetyl esterase/lipase